MILSLFLACSPPPAPEGVKDVPTPREAPPPPAELTDVQHLRIDIGRAAQSPERACAAIERAMAVAEGFEGADVPHGLQRVGDDVRPDWSELAIAVGHPDIATGLVTVGGLVALGEETCIDNERLESWTRRTPLLRRLPDCARDLLTERYLQELGDLRTGCTCSPVDPILSNRLAARTRHSDPDLADRLEAWATDEAACVKARTEASPAPPAPPKR